MKTETKMIKHKEDEIVLDSINHIDSVKFNSDQRRDSENNDRNNNNNINDNIHPELNNSGKSNVKYKSPMKNILRKPLDKNASNEISNPNSNSQFTDNNLRNPNSEISGIKLDIIQDNSNLKKINNNNNNESFNNQKDIIEVNKNNINELIDDCDEQPPSDQKLHLNNRNKYNINENIEDDDHNQNNHRIINNENFNNKQNFANGKENENEKKEADDDDNVSVFEYIEIPAGSSVKESIKEYWNNIKRLGPNKVYIFALVTVCVFNFISFAIQYWVSDHLKQVMHFNEDAITICFIVTCVTAPVSGVILGGCIVGKLGGYDKKKAVMFCLISAFLAAVDSIFIVFQESLLGFGVILWIFLFMGGAVIPNMLGK